MRIIDIEIYRDGGSIEFTIEKDAPCHVWLETPFKGEPREVRINSEPVARGSAEILQLLGDINVWWNEFPFETRKRVEEVLAHKGPFFNPDPDTSKAIELSYVLYVKNYLAAHYVA
jgi:hypothetical protein